MIITCPECETRFMISDHALGEEGRTVRCSKCAHTWFQVPEEDSSDVDDVYPEEMEDFPEEEDSGEFPVLSREDESDPEPDQSRVVDIGEEERFDVPIPEGIRPRSETLIEEEKIKASATASHKYGLLVAACVFAAIVMALYLMRPVITSTYPPSTALYQLFGVTEPTPGEHLIFERLQAFERENAIELNGQIVNMDPDEAHYLPPLAIALVSEDDKIMGHVYIKLEKDVIPAGEVYRFREVIANDGNLASAVIMRFALDEEMSKSGKVHDEKESESHAGENHDQSHDEEISVEGDHVDMDDTRESHDIPAHH